MNLRPYRALSFDCYGTLIDWESGILAALRPALHRHAGDLTDDAILEAFGQAEARREASTPTAPYPTILAGVHGDLMTAWGLPAEPAEARAFADSVGAWPAFPDTVEALRYLQEHFVLAILTNVDRASFRGTNERLGVSFAHIITAQDVGSYKPARANFEALLGELAGSGIEAGQLLHVAQSVYHDIEPARAIGLDTVWVDRRHDRSGWGATRAPDDDGAVGWRVSGLAELVARHRETPVGEADV